MKRNIILSISTSIAIFISSCNNFLDVHPKSSIAEKDLLTSEVGFNQALHGIYSQLASRQLYGDNLTMGFTSALAQNYTSTSSTSIFYNTSRLDYATSEVTKYTEEIWRTSYNAIAGLNNILAHIDLQKSNFTNRNYELTKGETLGLRAYLHFDLLRLFAPTYTNTSAALSIPYRKEFNSLAQKPSTVSEFINLLLQDLENAEALLKNIDPISSGDQYRKYYMNFYAVKALKARVLLYKGDKPEALSEAQAVINSSQFSFITNAKISTSAVGTKDRLFSTEQIFSIRVREVNNWVDGQTAYFKIGTNSNHRLTTTRANFNILYETTAGGSTDYRNAYLIEEISSTPFSSKYWQTWSAVGFTEKDRLDQTVPLIRLSEMYYIIAECHPDPNDAIETVNIVRTNRGLAAKSLVGTSIQNEITKEYQKEFYAEGQLFYYYKRLNFIQMQFRSGAALSEQNYILPIPDSETEFNTQYN